MEDRFEVWGNLVLVRPDQEPPEAVRRGLVHLSSDDEPDRGVVVAVGPATDYSRSTWYPSAPVTFDGRLGPAPGDHVLFRKYGGVRVELDGASYLVLQETDILMPLSRPANEAERADRIDGVWQAERRAELQPAESADDGVEPGFTPPVRDSGLILPLP